MTVYDLITLEVRGIEMPINFNLKTLRDDPSTSAIIQHYENTEDKSHGLKHIERVLHEAEAISAPHPARVRESVLYGALLHDIDREKDYKRNTNCHEITGVATAKRYLDMKAKHLTSAQINDILDAVRNHRSTTANKDLGLTAKIVSDADRLAVSYEDLARRAYEYRVANGAESDRALREGYWYLRNRKLKSLASLGNNLYLDESKRRHANKVEEFKELTKTFKDYQLLLGIQEPQEFRDVRGGEHTMPTKRAWIEAAIPAINTSPSTARLLERATRIAVRKEYKNAMDDYQTKSESQLPPGSSVQPVSGIWKDVTMNNVFRRKDALGEN